jgi:hypothetical protein
MLILVLLFPIIEAKVANITKTDFYKEPRQAFRLENGDGISFLKEDKEYIISIDEIGKNGVRLKSFAYKNNSRETFYLILNQKYNNKIDFEKDDIYDLSVKLLKIDDNRSKVDIFFEALNEKKEQTDGKINDNIKEKDNIFNIKGLIITLFIIVIGLFIYFLIRKKK